jgi:hypothetical protein
MEPLFAEGYESVVTAEKSFDSLRTEEVPFAKLLTRWKAENGT